MQPPVSSDLLRQHIHIDPEYPEADPAALHQALLAATEWVIQATHRPPETIPTLGPGGNSWPPTLTQAVLLMAAHFYNQREAVGTTSTTAPVPYGVAALIKPWVQFNL